MGPGGRQLFGRGSGNATRRVRDKKFGHWRGGLARAERGGRVGQGPEALVWYLAAEPAGVGSAESGLERCAHAQHHPHLQLAQHRPTSSPRATRHPHRLRRRAGLLEKLASSTTVSFRSYQLCVWQERYVYASDDALCYQHLSADMQPTGSKKQIPYASIEFVGARVRLNPAYLGCLAGQLPRPARASYRGPGRRQGFEEGRAGALPSP